MGSEKVQADGFLCEPFSGMKFAIKIGRKEHGKCWGFDRSYRLGLVDCY